MTIPLLITACRAAPDTQLSGSADEIRAIAQQGFFDGVRMAAALIDDPLTKAKLWALMRNAPNPSPRTTIGAEL